MNLAHPYLIMMFRTALLALLSLSLASTPSLAQEKPVRYVVELVLFQHTDPAAVRAEHWPETVATPDYASTTELAPAGVKAEFRSLKDSAKELTGAVKLLNDSERYTVVAHLVWEQPGLPSDSAVPVRVNAGKDYGLEFPELMQPRLEFDEEGNLIEIPPPESLDELEGTVRIVLGRYLHVYTDLLFRKPLTTMEYNEAADMLVPVERLRAIPVREWRRMRSRELHYMDHPLLGMLVKITPVATPEDAPGETTPEPAAGRPDKAL